MQPLRLDYAQRQRLPVRIGWLILIISLGTGAYLINAYLDLQAEKKAWQTHWIKTGHRQQTGDDTLNSEALHKLQPELSHANEVVEHLAVKWDELFKGLENAASKRVALLNIQPDVQKHQVILTAEAENFSDMLEYTKRLTEQGIFADVHVVNHQVQEQDPQKPIRFTVIAKWVDASPPVSGATAGGR